MSFRAPPQAGSEKSPKSYSKSHLERDSSHLYPCGIPLRSFRNDMGETPPQVVTVNLPLKKEAKMKIEHVALNVPEPAKAAQWYVEHLGMQIVVFQRTALRPLYCSIAPDMEF